MGYHFLLKYWDKIPINAFYKVLVFTWLGHTGSQYYNTGAIVKTFFNWLKKTWASFPHFKGPGFFPF